MDELSLWKAALALVAKQKGEVVGREVLARLERLSHGARQGG